MRQKVFWFFLPSLPIRKLPAEPVDFCLDPPLSTIPAYLPCALDAGCLHEAFFTALNKHESHFQNLLNEANKKGERLKYVAQLENGKAGVGLQTIDSSHDFYNLEGSDNIILFYTNRYKNQPLIIKGAGAGAEVTAGGIFGDIIRIGKS